MTRIGVDEAGKGPVLGPMIAAAVRADPAALPDGIDDSKRIAPARRDALDERLRAHPAIDVGVAAVEPTEIDDPETDMNALTVAAQARAVVDLLAASGSPADSEAPVTDSEAPATAPDDPSTAPGASSTTSDRSIRLLVDAGDVSEERFGRRVREAVEAALPRETGRDTSPNVSVTARHGADADSPLVGAASIVAKVERDRRMAAIDERHPDYDGVGSGYPSDPTTTAFLEAYVDDTGDVPDCARRSWRTCERLLARHEQSGLGEF
ncbi:RNase HII [Halopenitus malekzadehii]|uniref:Ribonuclease HII n=1 Tax=Halopenitus malekzadehii TaxID=1267564 RepID=A0A1H6J4Z8_9EURY|nr:ribonuclease HII [Halopenitus malekzadehii]SEH56980.1 RNase HII [Halopenitus malekzadehii]